MRKTQTDRFYADHATAAFSDYGVTFSTEEHSLEVHSLSADALRAAVLGYLDSFRYSQLGSDEAAQFLVACADKVAEVAAARAERSKPDADALAG